MATGVQKEDGCSLFRIGDLTIEDTNSFPSYRGIAVSGDIIMVLGFNAFTVRLHRSQDGKLLATHKLESASRGICLTNTREICVILENGQIVIMSVQYTESAGTITAIKTLQVKGEFDYYHGVYTFKENVVICGVKQDMICWCTVSLLDGHVDTVNQICKGDDWSSYLTTKDNTIYISCYAGTDSPNNAVYAYDIQDPSKCKYIYKHEKLKCPKAITTDKNGFMFVCNYGYPEDCIHHLTYKCELLSLYKEGIPYVLKGIFCDRQHGYLYITCWGSNIITRYKTDYPDPVIPAEVLKMDTRSIQMYKEALRAGTEKVYNIRVMVVGQYGVGKTTLTKRLLGKDVEISEWNSTEGIDVHIDCSKVSLTTGEWTEQEKNADECSRLQRLVKLLNEHSQKQKAKGEHESQGDDPGARQGDDNGHLQHDQSVRAGQEMNRKVKSNSSEKVVSRVVSMGPEASSDIDSSENVKSEDPVMEILQLVNDNPDKLEKNMLEFASLAMLDFAGHYVFYTTHQTFLSSRAIYLLVIDLSQQVTDLIKDDECYLDIEGVKLCEVHDLLEIWLNSIHSCSPSPQDGVPPVILVGTHVDKVAEKCRTEVIDKYFINLRYMLSDKPVIHHLKDDFAIDNTRYDPKLEELKRRIFELASTQSHWGEEKPVRWLPLEQAIMKLKASGIKVATRSVVEEINRSASVRIEDKDELDLFLRFQHDVGTILYFSVEGLREKIVLNPQWLIDALKSLITAEMFIRQNPAVTSKWLAFKKNGTLTEELIDAIWNKKKNPEFHDNKDHILQLMQKLNIIAKPRSFSEDGKEAIEAKYYLVPCMLRQATPKEIISPESDPEMESTSVLCFVSAEKFLPPPVFHRLLGACLTHWPISKQNSNNLIYCGCCVFGLDLHHRLTLYFRDYVICARVTIMGVKDMSLSSTHCYEARKFIVENLSNIVGNLGKSLQFELHVQCPKTDSHSLEGLIPVSQLQQSENVPCHSHHKSHLLASRELLKFWYKDGESLWEKGPDAGTKKQGKRSAGDQGGPAPKRNRSEQEETHGREIPTEAKAKHNQLCLKLDGLVTKEALKSIKRISRTYLDPKHLEKVKDMDGLLSALEEKGLIGVGNYDILMQILTDATVLIGVDDICKMANDIKYIMESNIPSQESNETPSLSS